MITARTDGGPAYPAKFEEMDKELTKVIEDFNHAVEALRLAKKSGEHLLSYPRLFVPNGVCSAGNPPTMG